MYTKSFAKNTTIAKTIFYMAYSNRHFYLFFRFFIFRWCMFYGRCNFPVLIIHNNIQIDYTTMYKYLTTTGNNDSVFETLLVKSFFFSCCYLDRYAGCFKFDGKVKAMWMQLFLSKNYSFLNTIIIFWLIYTASKITFFH